MLVAAAAAAAVVVVVVVVVDDVDVVVLVVAVVYLFLLVLTRSSSYLSLFLAVGRYFASTASQLLRDGVCFCAIRATLFNCSKERPVPNIPSLSLSLRRAGCGHKESHGKLNATCRPRMKRSRMLGTREERGRVSH